MHAYYYYCCGSHCRRCLQDENDVRLAQFSSSQKEEEPIAAGTFTASVTNSLANKVGCCSSAVSRGAGQR